MLDMARRNARDRNAIAGAFHFAQSMTTHALATFLILLSALLHAVVNALVKASDDGLLTRGCMNATALVVSLPLLAWVPAPTPQMWPLLIAATLVHGLYPFLLVAAYRHGDLSAVLPLARGVAPLGVAVLAAWFAVEPLTPLQLASVGLVSCGIAMLAFERNVLAGARGRRGVGFAIATGIVIACYTALDAAALRVAASPLSYIVWLFVFDGLFVSSMVAWVRRTTLVPFLRQYWKPSLLSGALGVATYGLALYALSLGAMVEIAALRETSVIFAAVIGTLILGEPFGRWRILAASIVVAGVILMRASR